jgi:nicotinamidase-related amidase
MVVSLSVMDVRSALIVVDPRESLAAGSIDRQPTGSDRLMAIYREFGLPVVLVDVAGEPTSYLIRGIQLSNRLSGLSDLASLLARLGVTQTVVAGAVTRRAIGVISRQARGHRFRITLASDAVTPTGMEAQFQNFALTLRLRVETGTSDEIISLLDPDP